MRTETHEVTIYKYAELGDDAKERVRCWVNDDGYNWSADAVASLKAFAEHFGAKVDRYELDWDYPSQSSVRFDLPDDDRETDERFWLAERITALGDGSGNCVLTGFCLDEELVDGINDEFAKGTIDLNELLQAGFRRLAKAVADDWAYQNTDEAVAECCEANEYEFYEDGSPA